jgi:hypothetical protein
MATTKDLLDVNQLQGELVQIMSKSTMIDPQSGRQMTYTQTAYLRGCDGMFIYYSFDPTGPYSGFMPITEIMDVIRIDHVENLMQEMGEDET